MKKTISALVAAAALAAPAVAGAHVTLQPDTAPAGGFARLDVRVPNERDDAGTVKVDVQLPPGVASASYEPVPGWTVKVTREQLDEPLDVHGEQVTEQVSRVTWTGNPRQGGVIEPGQFQDFGLSLRVPDGEPGDTLTFKALQTYQGGEVVRWIGPPDADEPAPTVTLTAAEEEHAAPAATAEPASAPADDDGGDDDGGGSDTLAVIALIVGALGLAAGVAGLLAARRAGAGVSASTPRS
jgi:uncharacterized protein YcnI